MIQRVATDSRGKITTGILAQKKDGTTYPQAVNYFNISAFAEIVKIYGDKPQKLVIVFPTNEITDFFHTEYSLWGGKEKSAIKKRRCDGEICYFKMPQTVGEKTYQPGLPYECVCKELPEKSDLRCKCYTSLKAFIVNYKTGKVEHLMPIRFETRSQNSSDIIYSQIANVKALTGGRIKGVPFILEVQMKEDIVEGQKRKFPIWNMYPFGTIDTVMDASVRGILPTTEEHALIMEEKKQIADKTTENKPNEKQSQRSDNSQTTENKDDHAKLLKKLHENIRKVNELGKNDEFMKKYHEIAGDYQQQVKNDGNLYRILPDKILKELIIVCEEIEQGIVES